MLRGALVGVIYNRALLSSDGLHDDSAAVTLMSTDIDRIAIALQSVTETWGRIIEVGIGMYLLERQLGGICVIPIIIVASKVPSIRLRPFTETLQLAGSQILSWQID